jgi:hypothetical protein
MKKGQHPLLEELPEESIELQCYNTYEFVNTYVDKEFNAYRWNGLNYFQYKLSKDGRYHIADENNHYINIAKIRLMRGEFNN